MRMYKSKLYDRLNKHWQLYILLIIPVVYLVIFHYVPMGGVVLAFKKYAPLRGILGSPWIGLENFQRFFSSYMFERVIINTFALSFYSLLAGFPIPIIFALCLNVIQNEKYKKSIQMISYAPHFISTTVLVGMINAIFNARTGMYGAIYKLITNSYPFDLFSSVNSFRHMYVWSSVWQNTGWSAIIYVAALASVDIQLHEAAQIDGANRISRIIHVDLPNIVPTISIMMILQLGQIMSVGFEKVYLMQNTINSPVSEIISTYVYKIGLQDSTDFSYSTAIGMFNSVVNLIVLIAANTVIRKIGSMSLF